MFDTTRAESELISAIVARAVSEFAIEDRLSLEMDLTANQTSGTPVDLKALLEADTGNFGHDVLGISRYINRTTGELLEFFTPRYSL